MYTFQHASANVFSSMQSLGRSSLIRFVLITDAFYFLQTANGFEVKIQVHLNPTTKFIQTELEFQSSFQEQQQSNTNT